MVDILLVDDSEVERRLAAGLLSKEAGFRVSLAADGVEAVDHMRRQLPDLVVTDLVMPVMDGLELIRTIRNEFPGVPVILLTAYGNETLAVEAIQLGAASYVPKASQAERLVDTVYHVLSRRDAERQRQRLLGGLSDVRCSFLLTTDPQLIRATADLVQHILAGMNIATPGERIRIGIAVEEALLNALCHGTLALSDEEVIVARRDWAAGIVSPTIEQRRRRPPYRNLKIAVELEVTRAGMKCRIRDKGPGFDLTTRSMGDLSDALERGRNRGMMLMHQFMDRVSFNEAGNEVTLVKSFRDG